MMEIRPLSIKRTFARFIVVALFSIAFAYIESAVVVYLREIFHPNGFTFPLADFDTIMNHKTLLLTEIGREAATIVLILTAASLAGRTIHQRIAWFLAIFAIWDIFYYLWLKVLIDWPASLMDWDILFLIPLTWASPVIYPLLISATMLAFALVILYRSSRARPVTMTWLDALGFALASLAVVASFCTAGPHITRPDYSSHFYPPLFALGNVAAIALFARCIRQSNRKNTPL